MCGIAGLIALDPSIEVSVPLLHKMTESIAHRGPDGEGYWTGEGAGLGHRRLAILDIEGGIQPWVEEDRAVLIYNGELYNYRPLRKKLEETGLVFRSNSDTEVVIKALLTWGIQGSLKRFRGMFAFALWEMGPRRLTLVRDHLGIKPLYWANRGGLLRFGSEIKTILADPAFPRIPDTTALVNYLAHYRLSLGDQTLFSHIREVKPGTFLQWEGKRRTETRYWQLPLIPEKEKEDPGEFEAISEFYRHLRVAVRRRLVSDVPVGAYLSGGIDSSAIVQLMKSIRKQNIRTYSIGFESKGYNEFEYSSLVAQSLQTPHFKVNMTENGYFRDFESLICVKDTPLSVPNEVPLRFLSKILKKKITVVLSGEGADELLGGYTLLMRSPHDYLLALALQEDNGDSFPPGVADRLRSSLQNTYGSCTFRSQLQQFLNFYQWIPKHERASLFSAKELLERSERKITRFWNEEWARLDAGNLDPYDKVMHILEEWHLGALLMRLDATTMAEGVEGRVPFTDIDLVEYVNTLPLKYKLRWRGKSEAEAARYQSALEVAGRLDINKYVLRMAFADKLPPTIVSRPKTAFPVPLDEWFFGPWFGWASERILTEKMASIFDLKALEQFLKGGRAKDEGMKAWMLTNIGIWLETYFGKNG